jgi:hypothetical protein
MKKRHQHLNTFKDGGRDNIEVVSTSINNSFVKNVVCEVFDESIQNFVKIHVHWHKIVDFLERRQPLRLPGAEVTGIVFEDGSYSFAKSWSRWNEKRGTWELDRIGAGAYGDTTVIKIKSVNKDQIAPVE